jgi:hypothetical protein
MAPFHPARGSLLILGVTPLKFGQRQAAFGRLNTHRSDDSTSVRPLELLFVEYRGIQYQIVETANPTGWKWTVQLDGGRTKTGLSFSREYAIFDATNAIEKALSATPKAD